MKQLRYLCENFVQLCMETFTSFKRSEQIVQCKQFLFFIKRLESMQCRPICFITIFFASFLTIFLYNFYQDYCLLIFYFILFQQQVQQQDTLSKILTAHPGMQVLPPPIQQLVNQFQPTPELLARPETQNILTSKLLLTS